MFIQHTIMSSTVNTPTIAAPAKKIAGSHMEPLFLIGQWCYDLGKSSIDISDEEFESTLRTQLSILVAKQRGGSKVSAPGSGSEKTPVSGTGSEKPLTMVKWLQEHHADALNEVKAEVAQEEPKKRGQFMVAVGRLLTQMKEAGTYDATKQALDEHNIANGFTVKSPNITPKSTSKVARIAEVQTQIDEITDKLLEATEAQDQPLIETLKEQRDLLKINLEAIKAEKRTRKKKSEDSSEESTQNSPQESPVESPVESSEKSCEESPKEPPKQDFSDDDEDDVDLDKIYETVKHITKDSQKALIFHVLATQPDEELPKDNSAMKAMKATYKDSYEKYNSENGASMYEAYMAQKTQ